MVKWHARSKQNKTLANCSQIKDCSRLQKESIVPHFKSYRKSTTDLHCQCIDYIVYNDTNDANISPMNTFDDNIIQTHNLTFCTPFSVYWPNPY